MNSRDDFNDPGAATWGNPGAVTVGYIPEEEPSQILKEALLRPGVKELEDVTRRLRFETSPQRDHGWRDLKIVSGQIIENRDTGDEAE